MTVVQECMKELSMTPFALSSHTMPFLYDAHKIYDTSLSVSIHEKQFFPVCFQTLRLQRQV